MVSFSLDYKPHNPLLQETVFAKQQRKGEPETEQTLFEQEPMDYITQSSQLQ